MSPGDLSVQNLRRLTTTEFMLRVDETVAHTLAKSQVEGSQVISFLQLAEAVAHRMNAEALEEFPGLWVPLIRIEPKKSTPMLGLVTIEVAFVSKIGTSRN